jgi:hypothetical protein
MEPVKEIKDLAEDVAANHVQSIAAIERERESAALLLVAVLDAVRQAAPALASRVPEHVKGDVRESNWQDAAVSHFPWRGIKLVGGPLFRADGIVEGAALHFDEDGNLRIVSYSGMWTKDHKAEWVSKASDPVTCRQVVDGRWSIEGIVETFAHHLRRHAEGARGRRADQAARLADRYEAIVTLLGEP